MAIAFLLTVIVGFARSEIDRTAAGGALEPRVIVHAVLFLSWFLIFFVQTTLAATSRLAWHRKIGYAAAVVAACITVNGPMIAVAAARRDVLPEGGLAFLLVIIGDVVGFSVFVAAALYHRRRAETHKRLMLLGTISMLPPAVWRWPLVDGNTAMVTIILLAFLAAAPVHDLLSRRRVHPVSLWGGLALFLSAPVRIAISQTEAWHRFASWLVG
jgi:hypothetical protein